MRNGNFSYHITGLVRSVYDKWEMDNSHITNEELKIHVHKLIEEIWKINL